jgi:hypothetical protein
VPGEDIICLWPKNVEELRAQSAAEGEQPEA